MKILQAHMKKELDLSVLDPIVAMAPHLLTVFGGRKFFDDGKLGSLLRARLPQTLCIGCSTAGEILDSGAVYDDTLVFTGIQFNAGTEIFGSTAVVSDASQSKAVGAKLGAELQSQQTKSVFVLAPGLNINGSAFVDGLKSALKDDVVVTGGLAGDGGRFQKTYTLFNETVSTDRAVSFGLKGAQKIGYGSQGGWEPFGPERKVTRAESNVLFELDGKSALQLYKEYLGDKAKDLPAAGLFYPFAVVDARSPATSLIRTILNIDEAAGSLILAGDIAEGSTVRLMHAKSENLIDGATRAGQDALTSSDNGLAQHSDSLGILISCVGRKLVMGDDVDEEVSAVKAALGPQAVVTGFYSYGEIAAFNNHSREPLLHNQTMTITHIS